MADYTISKEITNNVYPVISSATSDLLGRCEPLITPDKLKLLYLKGIDLSDYSSDDLKILIEYAVNTFESESKLFVNKVQMKEIEVFESADDFDNRECKMNISILKKIVKGIPFSGTVSPQIIKEINKSSKI